MINSEIWPPWHQAAVAMLHPEQEGSSQTSEGSSVPHTKHVLGRGANCQVVLAAGLSTTHAYHYA